MEFFSESGNGPIANKNSSGLQNICKNLKFQFYLAKLSYFYCKKVLRLKLEIAFNFAEISSI